MIQLAADENFNHNLLRAVLRRRPDVDVIRVQEAGLSGADDPTVLEWTAKTGRILLTHDVRTITKYAYERAAAGLAMPGVFEVSRTVPIGRAVEDILLIVDCSRPGEWDGQVRYLPL